MPSPLFFCRRRSALTIAIRRDDPKKVANILSNRLESPTVHHLTSAISNASYSTLRTLLHVFENPTTHQSDTLVTKTRTPDTLTSALHAAAIALDPVSIAILLSSDVSPRAAQDGLEPLHIVAHKRIKSKAGYHVLKKVIEALVSAGALEGHFEDGLYPPNYAVSHHNRHAFSAMLSQSSESLSKSLYKYSTIRYVCTHASIDALSTLLPHVNITHADTFDSTPLHHAVSSPHAPESTILTMVQIISQAGCPIGRRDMHGRTPFQIARRRHLQSVVDFLVASGASEETFADILLRRAQRDARKKAARIVARGKVVIPNGGKCSICLDALSTRRAVETSCGHIHHSECLSKWVLTKPTCPLCKHRLP